LRRTVALAALVTIGLVLFAVVRAPEPPRPPAERGHRLFPVGRDAVRGLDVVLGDRRVSARRTRDGWTIDGGPAAAGTAGALDDLVATLVGLRAVDVFRDRDGASYGLERPRVTITLLTDARSHRLDIGDPNAGSSAFYARRTGDPRILEVGALVLTELERVFYNRDREG